MTNHTSIVTMFGKRRRCRVVAYGARLDEYTPDQTLWIERSEDQYAIPHYREPFCLLYREHWMRGEDV